MLKKLVVSLFAAAALAGSAFAEDIKCGANAANPDAECGGGTICILAMSPPVCRPPLPAGQACKRDKVCASNQCEKAAGAKPEDKGVCK
ncbi:Dickkopf N-terminal cysteine-rich domain-containing protein [Candidatus Magnetaquicoccus inordinatus]|uniref:Dickkopf N-terminal cysteine-rich domain-containing protein n=1 Tax=Candidatus Magnetaquicoccus inordinatus TaxID=2496818 RepID=UPI00102B552C|nr:Dickkopf N-terminal cysteine-rich domain-containing protein [Candidatus Magnetaquicoccus inordinatus]